MLKKSSKIFNAVLSIALSLVIMVTFATPVFAIPYNGSASYKSGKYYTRLTNVKESDSRRTEIVNIAKSQVGYHEGNNSSQLSGETNGSGNYTEYGRWYGLNGQPWCAIFVSWCAGLAGMSSTQVPKHASTVEGLNKYKSWGRAYTRAKVESGDYTPKPGDLIYFKSSGTSNITNHVGIVTKYSNKTVYTIEGNSSDAVSERSYSISNTYIVYICKTA